MQPPIAGKVVLGWDPAFRTGCKLAVVDETGKVIGTTVIYPTAPTTPKKIQASKDLLKRYSKVPYFSDFSWKWNGFKRVRRIYCRIIERNS